MSNQEQDNKQQEIQDKLKLQEMQNRMEALVRATLPDMTIAFKNGKKWEYDAKTCTMGYVPEDLVRMSDREAMSTVLHNMGHALFTTLPRITKAIPEPKRQFFQLMNAVEDIRAEEQMMQKFYGTYDSFKYKFQNQDSKVSAKVEKNLPPHTEYLYSLQKAFWGESLTNVTEKVQRALEDTEDILFDAYNAPTTQEMVEILADRLWPYFEELIPPPDDKNNDGDGEGEGEGNGEQKKQLSQLANSSISVEDIVKAMEQMSENEQQGAEGEKQSFKVDIDQKLDEEMKERLKALGVNTEQNEQKEPGLDGLDMEGGVGPSPNGGSGRGDFLSYEDMYREILPVLPFFKSRIVSIMKDNLYNRSGGSYRSGKLNTNKLYKFKAKSDKLFSRKVIRRHKDYKVTILVDMSGSMTCNSKNRNAAKATVLFAEVLNAAGIDFEIRGFNEYFFLYKKFGEKYAWKHRRNVERIMIESYGNGSGCNNDGFAVNQAIHNMRLVSNKETERILIVLSDGLPAESGSPIPAEDSNRFRGTPKKSVNDFDLKFEVQLAEKTSTVIGVGIGAHHVKDYYSQNVICDRVSELPLLVLNRLKSNIRRG